jgi:acyl-CoA thioesterase
VRRSMSAASSRGLLAILLDSDKGRLVAVATQGLVS